LRSLKPFRSRALRNTLGFHAGLAAAFTAAALVAVGVAQANGHEQFEQRAESARNRAAEAARGAESLGAQIRSDSGRIDGLEAEITSASREVAELERRLARSRAKLAALDTELRERAKEIAFARRQLGIGQRRLAERLVEVYTSNEPDTVTILLGADSLAAAIDGIETQERVLAQDRTLAEEVARERTRLTRAQRRTARLRRRQALEADAISRRTVERRGVLSALVSRRQALVTLRARRARSLAAIEVDRDEWNAEADALAAQGARLASVADASPAQTVTEQPAPVSSGAGFIWPVQGSVVSPFGQRGGRLHSGIDIAAPAGTAIAASAAGQVVYSGAMSGYGNIVVVQHAGGIATAYAHNASNAVTVGQSVSQGQTIASVGCTGRCFGDHVHFEVRVNGSPVDPAAYL
jgi:murein DD-endopeptidase MepM/ murein hydrolase activator NlpD